MRQAAERFFIRYNLVTVGFVGMGVIAAATFGVIDTAWGLLFGILASCIAALNGLHGLAMGWFDDE